MKITHSASRPARPLFLSLLLSVALGPLAGCGGGGGADPVTPTPPASTALTLTGTATNSVALAAQPVEARCATGTASGTTGADGSYSLSITGGAWPCAARVTAPDGSWLHTVASGTGSSAVANITPVTQLAVASLAGETPATYYARFGGASTPAVGGAPLAAAQAAAIAILRAAGVDVTGLGDVFTSALQAGGAGNAYAQALTQLLALLTQSGTTLATLTDSAAHNSVAVIGGALPTDTTPSLPAGLLLRPASPNCAALRSGPYRIVKPLAHGTLADQFETASFDAATGVLTHGDGSTSTWAANGPCRYLADAGRTDALVSQAGVVELRYSTNGGTSYRWGVAVPEQSHAVAELAGTWNAIGLQLNAAGTAYTGIAATATLDATGAQGSVTWCQNDTTWGVKDTDCGTPAAAWPQFQPNASGGFDLADAGTNAVNARAFAYRGGSGDLVVFTVHRDGSFQARTRQRSYPLPTVGAATRAWDIYVAAQLLSPSAVEGFYNVIQSTDTTAKSWTRRKNTIGANDARTETLFADTPRSGYTFRPAATAVAANGATVNINEMTNLPLRGMDMSGLLLPSLKWFDVSVGAAADVVVSAGPASACSPFSLAAGHQVAATAVNSVTAGLGDGTYTMKNNGAATFASQNATEFELTTPLLFGQGVLAGKAYLGLDGSSGAITRYGATSTYTLVNGATTTVQASTVVQTPPSIAAEWALAAGQSTTTTTVTQIETTVVTTNGVAAAPVTSTETHTILPQTFVGIESITVGAGTFNTCKFIETRSGTPATVTHWYLVGYGGAEAKNSQGLSAMAILYDGVALTHN